MEAKKIMAQAQPTYTMTNDTITVLYEGKTYTVRRGSANFEGLRKVLTEKRLDQVFKYLSIEKAVQSWADGKFTLNGNTVTYQGESLPETLTRRILAMVTQGEDPTYLCRFWERLARNPSYRSVRQLFGFLEHAGIPITKDGCFLAYKGVRENYKDVHSGMFNNEPGSILDMPRNKISDDPDLPCHEGLHVGALSYAQGFGPRVVVCKIDPEHVVCVPKDESQRKMRVCHYKVVGNYGALLPDTIYDGDEVPVTEPKTNKSKGSQTEPKKTKTPAPKGNWRRFQKMSMKALLDQPLEDLRKYATYGLKIVGASKIPGGKVSLIQTILKTRS